MSTNFKSNDQSDSLPSSENFTEAVSSVRTLIDGLRAIPNRTFAQNLALATSYVELARLFAEDGTDIEGIETAFDEGEDGIRDIDDDNPEIHRQLAHLLLDRGVWNNDFGNFEDAIECYNKATDALKPLEKNGDGEAKYDIAGITFNRGLIYYELGDFEPENYEKAEVDLDTAFTEYRAVEKISDLDTRFEMAKVSISQGNLLREMGRPLDKVVDAYNRAMRLFAELIDHGQLEHESELANTLLDRCAVYFTDAISNPIEPEEKQREKCDAIVLDVSRGIEILQRTIKENEPESRIDLFNALIMEASMLQELDRIDEARKCYETILNNFADFADSGEPALMNFFGSALENRGFILMNEGDVIEAIKDFDNSIAIRKKGIEIADEDDPITCSIYTALATTYANRAFAHCSNGNAAQAKLDCETGIGIAKSLADIFGDEYDEMQKLFETILEQMS